MPIEKHKTRSSPSVIARLMGLDTLPSVGPLKSQKEVNHDDSLLKKCKDEFLEFKDVFEVMDAQKIQKCNNQIAHMGMACSKVVENDMAFVRQSFINAKHLSTVEKLQRSKEFDDALDVLDSNKDFFLKLLQEPQSLFSKHLQELPYSPLSPHASHVSVLKPSRAIQSASLRSSLRSEENAENYATMQRRKLQSFGKRADKLPSFPSRKPMCSLPEKLSNSMCGGKGEARAYPSEIVILKPGPEKGGNAERAFPLAYFMSSNKHGVIEHAELLKAEFMDLSDEERGQKKSCDTLESTRHRTKGSTEIAGEVKRRSRLGNGRKFSVSYYSYDDKDEGLEIKFAKTNKSQAPYCDNNEFCSSFSQLSCPIESAVGRSSTRRESDQCRVTHHFEESSLSSRASNTLGEILALSDKETFKRNLDTLSMRKAYPVGISSKDGWKDGFCRSLPQSKYLPASSVIYGNFQNNHGDQIGSSKSRFKPKNSHDMSNAMRVHEDLVRKKCSSHDYGELSNGADNRVHVRDIHVNAEKLENRTFVGSLAEELLVTSKSSDNYSSNMVDNIYLPKFISGKRTSAADVGFEKPRNITNSEDNRKQVSCNHRAILPKEGSADHCEKVIIPSHCTLPFTVSPDNNKGASQPSSVSVLDLSPKKGESAVGCFKKISLDHEELQMQRQLLKLESTKSILEEIEAFVSSDEDACGDPIPHLADIQQALRDEEDRDYAYLLDMLIDSGVLKADESKLFSASHLIEHSAGPNVFDKLEKKYKSLGSWSRLERKLLFDLVNCTLEEISAVSYENMCPWFKPRISFQTRIAHEGLVEELWQAVAKQRKVAFNSSEEILVDSNWLDTQNDANLVSKELENMLHLDLMDELLGELCL